MTSFVTGGEGFIGSYLCEHLRAQGDQVVAPSRTGADVRDAAAMLRLLSETRPQTIFHLAAQSLPGISWENPAETFKVNVGGTIHVLEAVRAAGLDAQLVVAGSSAEYAPGERPIREDDSLRPSSPYAASKIAVSQMAELYGRRYGMKVVRVRPFFLIGPRKRGDVCSDLARRVVAIERGEATELRVGRLDIVRDFLDVRDGVTALTLLGTKGQPGEAYNICSGTAYTIGDVLETFRKQALVPIRACPDPSLLRPIDEPVKVGNPSKLRVLGWSSQYSLERSVGDILAYWRSQP